MITAIAVLRPEQLARGLAEGRYRFDGDHELEKRCNRCSDYWPADDEFFFTSAGCHDGLLRFCKACYSEKRAAATLHQLPDPERDVALSAKAEGRRSARQGCGIV